MILRSRLLATIKTDANSSSVNRSRFSASLLSKHVKLRNNSGISRWMLKKRNARRLSSRDSKNVANRWISNEQRARRLSNHARPSSNNGVNKWMPEGLSARRLSNHVKPSSNNGVNKWMLKEGSAEPLNKRRANESQILQRVANQRRKKEFRVRGRLTHL